MNYIPEEQNGIIGENNAIEGIYGRLVQQFIIEHLKNANLQRQGETKSNSPDMLFQNNEGFWRFMLRSYDVSIRRVELSQFRIIDWFPRTPGLFYTPRARESRQMARRYLIEEDGIEFFSPHGKGHMIEGGLGAIRFKPIVVGGSECQLCTATSDMYCHKGVPLAIPTSLLSGMEFSFDGNFKILGQVKFLPDFLEEHFRHMSGLPQIYILVDEIKRLTGKDLTPIKITPMVFFKGTPPKDKRDLQNEAYVTYVQCRANSVSELDAATEWINHYVHRFRGEIVTNFDQQRPTFKDAPFSLQNVMSGRIDKYQLQEFHIQNAEIISGSIQNIRAEAMTMTNISVTLGDGTTIHGDFVVANSIKDSFNKAASADIPDNLKSLLKDLAAATGKMTEALPEDKAKQVSRDLETLTEEATSKTPRKQWWELSLESIKQAATAVGAVGLPVLEIASKIVPLLTGLS